MFSKLKNKLKSWTQKFSKEVKKEEIVEELSSSDIKSATSEARSPTELGGREPDEQEKKIEEQIEIIKESKKPDLKKLEKQAKKLEKQIKKHKEKKEPETKTPDLAIVEPTSETPSQDNKLPNETSTREVDVKRSKSEPSGEQFSPDTDEQEKPEPGTQSFFQRVTSKISKVKISEKEFDVYAEELEMLLLENNVALEVTDKIIKELKQEIVNKEFLKKEIEGQINETIKKILQDILIEPFNLVEKIKEKSQDQSKEPYVVLFCGINGTGKTTTIAKIAQQIKDNNLTCVLAAADTFRAAAIDQLKKHGEKLEIKVIANEYGSDPASVAFDAIQYAKKNFINCVLIDTAGRMHSSKNLLQELEKINRVAKPDTKIFVGESITGNDAVEQVKSFNFAIGIDGIILSKADIDEKGGTALSVGYVTKKPILYLGTGQEYDKIEVFDKQKFIEKLGLD